MNRFMKIFPLFEANNGADGGASVDISPEEAASSKFFSEQPDAGEKSGGDTPGNPEDDAVPAKKDETKYSIGEDSFTTDELSEMVKNYHNDQKWKAENTTKSQEIAAERKAIQPFIQLLTAVKGNEALNKEVMDTLTDELGRDRAAEIEAAFNFDPKNYSNPFEAELNTAKEENQGLKDLFGLHDQVREFSKAKKISLEDGFAIMDFAVERGAKGELLTLETAHKLWMAENRAGERPKITLPVNIDNSSGANDIQDQKVAKTLDDIKPRKGMSFFTKQ